MLIRSQNKEKLLIMDTLVIETVRKSRFSKETEYQIVDGEVIGTYSTKEKALKVMDMIENKYKEYTHRTCSITAFGSVKPEFAFYEPRVFQMPADEDV